MTEEWGQLSTCLQSQGLCYALTKVSIRWYGVEGVSVLWIKCWVVTLDISWCQWGLSLASSRRLQYGENILNKYQAVWEPGSFCKHVLKCSNDLKLFFFFSPQVWKEEEMQNTLVFLFDRIDAAVWNANCCDVFEFMPQLNVCSVYGIYDSKIFRWQEQGHGCEINLHTALLVEQKNVWQASTF